MARLVTEKVRGWMKFMEGSSTDFQDNLVELAGRLRNEIIKRVAEGTRLKGGSFVANAGELTRLEQTLRSVDDIIDSGMSEQVRDLLSQYPRMRQVGLKALRDQTGSETAFSRVDLMAFRIATESDARNFADISRRGAAAIKEGLQRSVTGEEGWDTWVSRLDRILFGSRGRDAREATGMMRAAATYANDAIASLNREATRRFAKNAEIEKFTYFGGIIPTSRPFCVDLMERSDDGETWTLDQIDEMDNSPPDGAGPGPGSVFVACGGINCIHMWVPVVEESA